MTISWHDVTPQAPQRLALGEYILGDMGVDVVHPALGHPTLSVDMDVLAADASMSESVSGITQLRTHLPVTQHDVPFDGGSFKVAQTAEHVFGVLELDAQLDIQTASYRAYQALLACCKDMGKPYLLRLWNYIPHINAPESGEVGSGEERYRLFNTGRRAALLEAHYLTNLAKDGAPAACALGSHRGSFKVAFLAATRACVGIENPRQVSAYNYPKDYGVNPPIFARAGWFLQAGGKDILFISGTASIVGHQTLHIGDVALQTRETITNIQAVLQEANRLAGSDLWTLRNLHGQVYVRNRADMPTIQAILKQHALLNFTYLHADICRAELLVEIEACAQL